jgi:hypothetical protein
LFVDFFGKVCVTLSLSSMLHQGDTLFSGSILRLVKNELISDVWLLNYLKVVKFLSLGTEHTD